MGRVAKFVGLALVMALPSSIGPKAFGQTAPTAILPASGSVFLPLVTTESVLTIAGEVTPYVALPGDVVPAPSARTPARLDLGAFDGQGFRARTGLRLPINGDRISFSRSVGELFQGTVGPFPSVFALMVEFSTGVGHIEALRVTVMASHPAFGTYFAPQPFTLNIFTPRTRPSGAGE